MSTLRKRIAPLILALALCLSLSAPALASDQDFYIQDGVLLLYMGPGGDVVIPNGVTEIGPAAFFECESLRSVSIPDSVTRIGEFAFASCTGLTSVVIPESVAYLGDYAFQKCSSLRSVTFPAGGPLQTRLETADYYRLFWGDGLLEELVNCPSEDVARSVAINEASMDVWINLGGHVQPQSQRVTALSDQICAGAAGDYEKARAIFDWVSHNIRYDYEYLYGRKTTLALSVDDVLDSGLSVCAGYSRVTAALLQAQGIPAVTISGAANGVQGWPAEGQTNHDWNAAYIDGRWVFLDTTWGRPSTTDEATGEAVDGGDFFNLSWFDPTLLYLSLSHRPVASLAASEADTPDTWAQPEVREAMYAGLIPNDIQSAYREDITREDFCRLMISLVEQGTGQSIGDYLASRGLTVQDPFEDTDDGSVLAAYALGIVNGTAAGKFSPDGFLTRQEAAVMLTRTGRLLGLSAGSGEAFADAEKFASWGAESIAYASGLTDPTTGSKVMAGTGGGKFSPEAQCTREQAIIMALRLLHCAAKQ